MRLELSTPEATDHRSAAGGAEWARRMMQYTAAFDARDCEVGNCGWRGGMAAKRHEESRKEGCAVEAARDSDPMLRRRVYKAHCECGARMFMCCAARGRVVDRMARFEMMTRAEQWTGR